MDIHMPLLRRRSFICHGLGGLAHVAGFGSLPSARAATSPARKGQAKQVLVIFEQGGVSHIDTFDPKPDATTEHRSPFKTISTVVPGMQFTELLSRTAKVADKLSVVRCMTQPTPGIGDSHPKGSQYIFSGEAPGGRVPHC